MDELSSKKSREKVDILIKTYHDLLPIDFGNNLKEDQWMMY